MSSANLTSADMSMRDLIAKIVQALVDKSDEVTVELREENATVTLQLKVAAGDVGKIIGKQGRTARSLRTILGAASMKHGRRYCLDIREEDQELA